MTADTIDPEELAGALERVTRGVERYAKEAGFALQPDEVFRRHVLQGMAENMVRYGKPYCPCRKVTGDPEKDRANICPCRSHREQIGRFGECECGLFVKSLEDGPVTRKE